MWPAYTFESALKSVSTCQYLITLEWANSLVNHSNVFDEIGLLVEAVLAVATNERTLVQVNSAKMAVQVTLRFVLKL